MEAASERTWKYLQRVTGGGYQFMSLAVIGPAVKMTNYLV
jgi:hypothetical protein